ncbi:MAG: late competence development ComFB family protein [Synechococcaceae cyanobacterium SM2_3_60]|nr:late competence development ComFB family protein [Synechococcaceae cyanobacterium SM2_3_60]
MSWQDGVTKYVLVNVLEEVVMKESEFQHSQLPPAMQDKVAVIDIGAYVLNRIPPMYASNKQGWGFQREKALRRAHLEIAPKVKEAIQYLQRAPMRMSAPLPLCCKLRMPEPSASNSQSAGIDLGAGARLGATTAA